MKAQHLLLFLILIFLIAACGAEGFPGIQDAYDEVTVTPTPVATAQATPPPMLEDAGGIGRAFYRAWELNDLLGMYSLLSPQSQALVPGQDFVQRYQEAMTTANVKAIRTQPLSLIQDGNNAEMGMRVTWETAVFGNLIREYNVPLVYQDGRWGISWEEGLILPELSGGNHLTLDIRVPARANIYDNAGRALAYQGTALALSVIRNEIEDEAGLLNALSTVLRKPPEEIQASYATAEPNWKTIVGEISATEMQENAAILEPYFGKGLAPPEQRLTRLYAPQGAAPHIVGYIGPIPAENAEYYRELGYDTDKDRIGLAGLEAWGEDYLNGERGGILRVVNASGNYITTLAEVAPQQSRSIYTTLDYEFQATVEQALAQAIQTYPGASAGSAIVMDVNTGDIKAIASYPSYDPAIFNSLDDEAKAQLNMVLNDPQRPLLNRATQGAYPSGSIFKIITLSAAIESGLFTADSRYTSTGSWNGLGDNFIKYDWLPGGHGTISLRQALVVSCNSCFYNAGMTLDNWDNTFLPNMARGFGLGAETGIEVSESVGIIPDPDWKLNTIGEGWATGDAVNMAIGQGFVQVTPLQFVTLVAAIANGGTLYQPSVVDRIGAGGGLPEESLPPHVNGQLPISASTLETLRSAMFDVANSGSGTATHQFLELPIQVAGKTGTAEDPPRNSHAWFVGYAPAAPYTKTDGTIVENPEIAIIVMIENAGEGSAVAAPIFRRLVELYYGIQPERPFPWGG